MKVTKIISLLLLIAMLICAISGCSKKGGNQGSSSHEGEATTTGAEGENRLPLTVAKEDNEGREFRYMVPAQSPLDVLNEENTASRIEQSKVNLKRRVEEHLGVKLVYENVDCSYSQKNEFHTKLNALASDPDSCYDLLSAELAITFSYAMEHGLIMDLNTVNSIKVDSPWYLKDMNKNYALKGKLYGVVSDATLTLYSATNVIYFNQQIVSDNGFTSPYEYVAKGEWYAEQMFGMALAYNGGVQEGNIETDSFGYTGHHVASRGYMTAFNVDMYETDANGNTLYRKNSAPERLVNIYEYMYQLFNDNPTKLIVVEDSGYVEHKALTCFKNGRSMIHSGFIEDAETLRSVEWDYGIVPMPKYDEDQKEFYSPIGTQTGLHMILLNARNPELSGKVLEVKSYYAHYDLVPEYYDVILKGQYARDPKVLGMLDIIRESATLSFLGAYGGITSPDPYIIFQMSERWRNEKVGGNVATYYKTNIRIWNNQLLAFYNSIGK